MRNIIIYGAGDNAYKAISHAKDLGYTPICFVDSDKTKHGNVIADLPVLSFTDAVGNGGGHFGIFPLMEMLHVK